MAHRTRQDYPTPSPSPSPSPTVKQEELHLSDSISSPHLESTRTLALALPEPQRQLQPNNQNRISPCEQCRKVRRACKWVKMESLVGSSCERCRKTGKQCSGPTRRSQTILEIGQPLRQLQTRRQAVASIGPSSPESRWSTMQMSCSLTYHLVQLGLHYLPYEGYVWDGFDYSIFLARFRRSSGRLDDTDPISELFALSQMVVGSHCTTHSALFPTSPKPPEFDRLLISVAASPDWTNFGLARYDPFLAVIRRTAERAQSLRFRGLPLQEATQTVWVLYFVVKMMLDMDETERERLDLLRSILRHALEYLSKLRASGSSTGFESFILPLQGIMREEIRQSLILNQHTIVTPNAYSSLFEKRKGCFVPTAPPDLFFVFSTPPESPDVKKAAFDFQAIWLDFTTFYELEALVAFSSARKISASITYTLDVIEQVLACTGSCIDRIFLDSRFDPNNPKLRPRRCLMNLIDVESDSMTSLRICHNLILRVSPTSSYLETSRRLWFEALSRTTHRLTVLPQCAETTFDCFSACINIVARLRLCPAEIVHLWAKSHFEERDRMIASLRFVSFGSPTASQFIRQLEIR